MSALCTCYFYPDLSLKTVTPRAVQASLPHCSRIVWEDRARDDCKAQRREVIDPVATRAPDDSNHSQSQKIKRHQSKCTNKHETALYRNQQTELLRLLMPEVHFPLPGYRVSALPSSLVMFRSDGEAVDGRGS
jgi:hypothetical protein